MDHQNPRIIVQFELTLEDLRNVLCTAMKAANFRYGGRPAQERLAREVLRMLTKRNLHRVRFEATDAWLEIDQAGDCKRCTWEQIASLRWTPWVLMVNVEGPNEALYVPRRVLSEDATWFLCRHARRNLEGEPRIETQPTNLIILAIGVAVFLLWACLNIDAIEAWLRSL